MIMGHAREYVVIITSQNKLVTVGEGDGTDASIASWVSVEKVEVECAPDGDHAPFAAS